MRPLLAAPVLLLLAVACATPTADPRWSLARTPLDRSASGATLSADRHVERIQELREELLAVQGTRTIANTFSVYSELLMEIDAAFGEARLLSSVHPDEAVRDAASEVRTRLSALASELSLDVDVYQALAAIDASHADEATRFALEKELDDYRRAGIDQSAEVRARLKALDAELTDLGQAFDKNIRDDVREIRVAPERLAGLPEDFLASHQPGDDGLVVLNTTYPDYQPVMRYCEDDGVRQELFTAYLNRAYPQNKDVLEQLIATRQRKARLLGYDSWADYSTEDKMIGSALNAAEFIERVATAARDAALEEQQRLLAFKRQHVDADAERVEPWESGWLGNKLREQEYGFDSKALRPYFDFARVQAGVLELNERLYGVRFEQVHGLPLWHESVTAWDLFDGGDHLGRFYLDLHPRDGKYSHAACFPYRSGIAGRRLPQATLVCNFPDPADSEDGLALMEYGQVRTFFHEFGHLMHYLFAGRRAWPTNAGIATEWDFVEAPSQMLEEWMADVDVLQSFALHHETDEPVPAGMVAALNRSQDFGKASQASQQLFYAAVSLHCYSRDPEGLDTDALVQELQGRYSPARYVPGTHMQTSFGHLNGYSANYYTYKWSEVIAKDMFTRFAEAGVMDTGVAAEYRERVLEPGGSKPAGQLVHDFLGRPHDFAAYEAWLTGSADAD